MPCTLHRGLHGAPIISATTGDGLSLPLPGTYEIWARVTDALGRSQPLDGTIFWNPNSYEWTGVFKCEVTETVRRLSSTIRLSAPFVH